MFTSSKVISVLVPIIFCIIAFCFRNKSAPSGLSITWRVLPELKQFQTSRDMLAYGNVVVVSVDGDVLETDSLRYVNADDFFWFEDFFGCV